MTVPARLRLGTRGSELALIQEAEVRSRLIEADPELAEDGALETVVIKTTGDRIQDRRLSEIGGKGLFTKEIEEALVDGRIDLAVHSMKDVPTWLPAGLTISTILPREDARDAFFSRDGTALSGLAAGKVVGTSSLRRQAQLLLARPDLKVVPLRGNVQTRLRKLAEGQIDATILAYAGLKRLGQAGQITLLLEPETMLPAVAQGAIGLEIRADDQRTRDFLAPLDDLPSSHRVSAERAALEVLDGSCKTPIAAYAELLSGGAELKLRALIALPDGSEAHHVERQGPVGDARAIGTEAGHALRDRAGPAFLAALGDAL